jgi:hypothetical protein
MVPKALATDGPLLPVALAALPVDEEPEFDDDPESDDDPSHPANAAQTTASAQIPVSALPLPFITI